MAKLVKGSPEAKARMAYLRSLRQNGGGTYRRSQLAHSPEIQYIINSIKAKKAAKSNGGAAMTTAITKGLQFGVNNAEERFTDWHNTRKSQKDQIAALKKQIEEAKKRKRGGKFNFKDFIMGPVGWAKMIATKVRENKIKKLQAELQKYQ